MVLYVILIGNKCTCSSVVNNSALLHMDSYWMMIELVSELFWIFLVNALFWLMVFLVCSEIWKCANHQLANWDY